MKKPKRSEIAFKNAYIDLLLNEDRDKIFVRTICEKSGYSAMCFYQNYVSKEKFTQKIIDDEIEFYIDNLAEFSDLLYSCNATEEACVKCKKNSLTIFMKTKICTDAFSQTSWCLKRTTFMRGKYPKDSLNP